LDKGIEEVVDQLGLLVEAHDGVAGKVSWRHSEHIRFEVLD